MRGRIFSLIVTLALGLHAGLLPANAQEPGKMYRIGYLRHTARPNTADEAFFQALSELGWIEGQNIAIEYRWAAGKRELVPALAKELVDLKVDLIVTAGRTPVLVPKQATKTIPIVMQAASDAVESGIIASLAKPGGNITGMSESFPRLHTKLLELLHETLPRTTQVAVIWSPASPVYTRSFELIQATAPDLGLTIQSLPLQENTETALANALEAATRKRPGALIVVGATYNIFGKQIAAFAATHQMPVFSCYLPEVEKYFGLLGYAHDLHDLRRRAATYVDKILKGANPAGLPVQRPQKFSLVVNLKTAKAIGLTIPPTILFQATKIIQ